MNPEAKAEYPQPTPAELAEAEEAVNTELEAVNTELEAVNTELNVKSITMNPEAKAEYPQPTPAELAEVEEAVNTELNLNVEPGALSKLPPAERTTRTANQQWQQFNQQLSLLIERLNELFKEYKRPLSTAGIALAVIPVVVLLVSILEVIDAIPFLSSAFELVGFGFTSWFVYRYLLFVEGRQEFSREFQGLKERVLGKNNPSA